MKRVFLFLAVVLLTVTSYGQLQDEQNVTITMDMQPILQLNMQTPDQIDFVFDDIYDYYGGITKYGATILKVSSSVNWDLYAVGYSNDGQFWDQQLQYGAVAAGNAAVDDLPLSALEIYQYLSNTADANATGTYTDYSTPFTEYQNLAAGNVGQNSIFYSATPYTVPGAAEKYVQGHGDILDFQLGGSYLTQGATTTSIYYTVLDYRILPGLPAIFPFAGQNDNTSDGLVAPAYAQPGVYTMNVKYVLLENQ